MSRPSIGPRLQRMLTLIPWVRAHPEGVPVDEACARFGIDRARLLADIDALRNVGVEPYLPGDTLEVTVSRGRIFAFIPLSFTRPLRLTPAQALALVASANALVDATAARDDDPLRRALDKLATTLGIDTDDALLVDLGPTDAEHLAALRRALADGRQVEIDYYSSSRDDRSRRVVDPYQVVSMGGHWYLSGWCHVAEGDRLFRLDRIAAATVLDADAAPHPDREPLSALHVDERTPRVTLDVDEAGRWAVDGLPADEVGERPGGGGGVRVTLPVASPRWLHRLLVQLGPLATVVDDPSGLAAGADAVALAVLSRHGVEAPAGDRPEPVGGGRTPPAAGHGIDGAVG